MILFKKVHAVKVVDGSIVSDFSISGNDLYNTPGEYILMDCLDGRCLQTEGYIYIYDKVIAFVGEGPLAIGQNANSNTFINDGVDNAGKCIDASYVGKLYNTNIGICINKNGKAVNFSEDPSEEEKRYIIICIAENIPFANHAVMMKRNSISESTAHIIRRGLRYLIMDKYYSSKLKIYLNIIYLNEKL